LQHSASKVPKLAATLAALKAGSISQRFECHSAPVSINGSEESNVSRPGLMTSAQSLALKQSNLSTSTSRMTPGERSRICGRVTEKIPTKLPTIRRSLNKQLVHTHEREREENSPKLLVNVVIVIGEMPSGPHNTRQVAKKWPRFRTRHSSYSPIVKKPDQVLVDKCGANDQHGC
jgi:hypothetical protein